MINEGKSDMKCRAFVLDNENHRLDGPWITMEMAEKEGWINKSGSKWKTMPEVMIRYRAVSFFARLHCSDLTMGLYTAEEVVELSKEDYNIVSEQECEIEKEIEENANKEEIDINVEEVKDTKEVSETVSSEIQEQTDKPDF